MMTVKTPASSDDELIDFDYSVTKHAKGGRDGRLGATNFSDVEMKEQANGIRDVGQEVEEFKVVGQLHVPATSNPRMVVAPWVLGATAFSANVADKESATHSLQPMTSNLSAQLLSTLAANGIHRWFPVQKAVLPMLLSRPADMVLPPRDTVIYAPTGSGKTLCYVVPILNVLLRQDFGRVANTVVAIVVTPVKDLARQVYKVFLKYGGEAVLNQIALLNGDNEYEAERNALFGTAGEIVSRGTCGVVVCTPGRLVEHLVDPTEPVLDLSSLRCLVVDEADRMQDTARMEWLKLVESRARASDTNHLTYANLTSPARNPLQKILLSATLSLDVDRLHTWNLRAPQLFKAHSHGVEEVFGGDRLTDASARLNTGGQQQELILPSKLSRRVMVCELGVKPLLLYLILAKGLAGIRDSVSNSVPDCFQLPAAEKKGGWRKVIVFTNKRLTSLRLNMLLNQLSGSEMRVAEMSRNLKGKRRFKCLKRFRTGETRVLVSSDVISHGIDVEDVDCVVNYDLPANERIFIHRAGRTARADRSGFLLSLVSKEEKMRMKKMLSAHQLWNDAEVIDQRRIEELIPLQLLHQYQKALDGLRDSLVHKPSTQLR